MNHESGYGANGIPYEYTVAERKSAVLRLKKLTLIILYCLYAVGLFVLGATLRLVAPLIALVPVTLWMIIFFTWRYTQVEYEYSYFAGVLTVSRVLGGRSRKKLAEITLKGVTAVYRCDEEGAERIEAFGEEKTVFAASSAEAEGLYAALWCDEDGKKHALYFEPTEKALKIIRYYNASAVARTLVSRTEA